MGKTRSNIWLSSNKKEAEGGAPLRSSAACAITEPPPPPAGDGKRAKIAREEKCVKGSTKRCWQLGGLLLCTNALQGPCTLTFYPQSWKGHNQRQWCTYCKKGWEQTFGKPSYGSWLAGLAVAVGNCVWVPRAACCCPTTSQEQRTPSSPLCTPPCAVPAQKHSAALFPNIPCDVFCLIMHFLCPYHQKLLNNPRCLHSQSLALSSLEPWAHGARALSAVRAGKKACEWAAWWECPAFQRKARQK